MGDRAAHVSKSGFNAQIVEAVAEFGKALAPRLRAGVGGPEDQLRGPLEILLKKTARALGLDVVPHGEATLAGLGVRPDYVIDVTGAQVGCIEVKAPGKGVPTNWRPNAHDRAQWDKLKGLPNVLYTDGEQWALYHAGERAGPIAWLHGDLARAGHKLRPADGELARVLSEFLYWRPSKPRTIGQLVRAVAGLCRLLRDEVLEILEHERVGERAPLFTGLAQDWRGLLFPKLTNAEFADAYAQTVTFALLLARVDGIAFEEQSIGEIALQLRKKHSLMGKALAVLTEDTVEKRSVVIETLARVIGAVDWDELDDGKTEAYAYLYERFLEVYDPQLRKQSGSYYTPNAVASFMVRFVDEILRERLHRSRGFATNDVILVDPAMGTGTFLVEVIRTVAQTVEREEGQGQVPPRLRALFKRLVGFEKQAGPYAVAELRVHQALKAQYKTDIPEEEVRFLTDTLDNPNLQELRFGQTYDDIARSREGANKVKRQVPVMVVIGNPPYRERAKGQGKWVEEHSRDLRRVPSLDAFRAAGKGKYEYVLSNLYVYFWRWATWKVFDAHPDHPAGVVAFITTSGYTTGPGFAGMREYLRRTADEGWIIDLSPEGHQPPIDTRVFPGVQHPLCIGVFVRYGAPRSSRPAAIHHLTVPGLQAEKFARLERITLDDAEWVDCPTGWQERLVPNPTEGWRSCPLLGDLMPWAAPGVKPNRTWVYAPAPDTLRRRWNRLVLAPQKDKARLFKETRDRKLSTRLSPLHGLPEATIPIGEETSLAPLIATTAYRSFDRQHLILDRRVIDFLRPDLWRVRSDRQVFVTEQHAYPLSTGPGLVFATLVPDMHHFMGHHGGRVLPLYRDLTGRTPNIAPRLLGYLGDRLGVAVIAEDLLAYLAGVVAHSGYTERFRKELHAPGARVPLTADPRLWSEAVELGREVLWLHTYGQRYADAAGGRPFAPPRLPPGLQPKVTVTIPDTPQEMPGRISYDPRTRTLQVGAGQITPVPLEVWAYEVSGMRIVKKWFGYRKKRPAGRRSSPLDDINAEAWTPDMTAELLDLLHVLGRCVALEPRQAELLSRICAAPQVTVPDLEQANILPIPEAARKPPPIPPATGTSLF